MSIANRLAFDRLIVMKTFLLLTVLILIPASDLYGQSVVDSTVQVTASVQKLPPQITLNWTLRSGATGNQLLYRREIGATSWGTAVATLASNISTYVDSNVIVGHEYEYQVVSGTSGFIVSGIELPLVESRGTVILVVDATYVASLNNELERLKQDLIGDGWTVLRHDVARNETVQNVKALIKTDYLRDPANTKAVFLFGHVPVPYSGAIAPDGHGDHVGAWPADVYYGDMDGTWTDTQSLTQATTGRQSNIPGDGKFDQSYIPSSVKLEVGRVDLANMPAFAPKTELDLLRQYLNKDHNFRHKLITAQRRGLIDDNFGYFGGESFASSGWRNFAPFFGTGNVQELDWFTTLSNQSYLWAYGCGGGWYQGAGGVGSTSNFVATDTKTIFTMLFGSYFGDWDTTDNFLRAPLATTTYGLTSAWAGRPHWYFHHMALGESIGYSARLTQNNNYQYGSGFNSFNSIHVALMGDPTLRMHIVAPAANLSAGQQGSGRVGLQWSASLDADRGYNLYRAPSTDGPFVRVNNSLITALTYSDTNLTPGHYVYMLRAVKLESSASGTYFNASQGITQSVDVANTAPSVALSSPLPNTSLNAPTNITLTATATDNDGQIAKVEFFQGTTKLGESLTAPYSFVWNNVSAGAYTLTARATDNLGATALSTAINITVIAPPVKITGQINTADAKALAQTTVTLSGTQSALTLTDANGNYVFSNLPSSGNYVVTATRGNYNFSPTNKTFNNLTSDSVADFTATPIIPILSLSSPAATMLMQVCAPDSIVRAVAPLPNVLTKPISGEPDQESGLFPQKLNGFQILISDVPAQILTLGPLDNSSVYIDFVVPSSTIDGDNVGVQLRQDSDNAQSILAAQGTVSVKRTAPALWTVGTEGLVLSYDSLTLAPVSSNAPGSTNWLSLFIGMDGLRFVTFYGTGLRNAVDTDQSNNSSEFRNVCESYAAYVRLNDGREIELPLEYVGPQNQLPGLDMIVIKVPLEIGKPGRVGLRLIERSSGQQANPGQALLLDLN